MADSKWNLTAFSHVIKAERSLISAFQMMQENLRYSIKICGMPKLPNAYAGVLIAVPLIITLVSMKSFSKEALVERLRGAEC